MGARDGDGDTHTGSLKQTVQDASSHLSDAAEGLKEKVAGAAEQAKAGMSSGLDTIRSRTAAAISDTTESARATASKAADAVSATYRSGIDAASRTGDQLNESFRQSRESLFEAIESHPFLVGGVGLCIGAVIASALPVSQAENRLFGDTSDDLKTRARDVASEGLQVAKTAAQDVYQETVSRAQQQGLTRESVQQTVKDVGDKVKNVVQQATEALDEKPENESSPSPSVGRHT
jgi:gas vesicle protein